jgi:type II secretory pathway component PulC
VGTIEGSPAVAEAVFEDPQTKKQKLYRVGDVIDGATIIEIKNHQVLLRRGTRTEVVHMTGGSPVQRAPGDDIQVVANSDDPRENLQSVLSQVIPPYDRRVEKLRNSLSREEFDRFVEHFRAASEPPKFVETVAGPALSVADVDRDVLKNLKLDRADLIVGISGMGIESMERLTQIWELVSRAKVVDISVLRSGAVKPLYYVVH